MPVNPKRLIWTAPTENVDETPIDYELAYRLEADGEHIASFPGFLNPDGTYEVLFADLSLGYGEFSLTLRAFDAADPERVSEPSNAVAVSFLAPPNPPANLAASA